MEANRRTAAVLWRRGAPLSFLFACALLCLAAQPALAQGGDPNACDFAGDEPDVIVGDIDDVRRWGKIGAITGFSIGTVSCNIGTCWLDWYDDNGANDENRHPVIGQNLFRLKDGRFEQIGQSWLKHGFFAVNGNLCESGCIGTNGDHLGVNCSDPYSTQLNGSQTGFGPKFEVNASNGYHPHPVTDIGETGNAIFKRLQVHDADLDPTLNAGASYFVEAQYVARDDAGAKNQNNNASHRPVDVADQGSGFFEIDVEGSTVREQPAILAWSASDGTVEVDIIDVPGDGRLYLATKVSPAGAGMWHYEYAIHNLTSDRAVGSVSVPTATGASLANVGFHDVAYHSGEPFDGTDWTPATGATSLSWATTPHAVDPNANALRWGTLYNFRFDTNAPPAAGPMTLGLFKPGTPGTVQVETLVPAVCNEDSICDLFEECLCALDCPTEGTDLDGDGVGQCVDCKEGNSTLWATPSEVTGLLGAKGPGTSTTMTWSQPLEPGAASLTYEVLRTPDPTEFSAGTQCLADGNPSDTSITDPLNPFPTNALFYLIRATNGCDEGEGPLGEASDGTPRAGRSCP
jgi:hypothetical protein